MRSFEAQDGQKRAPPGIRDALGQVVVPYQVADLQRFVIDRVVLTHQGERGLMVEVLALPSHVLRRFGEPTDRLPATVAPRLPLRHPTLALGQVPLRLAVAAWIMDHGP